MDNRYEFFIQTSDAVFEKLQKVVGTTDLITYCLDELEGCEKLYGLMFIFTQLGDLEQEDKELIHKVNTLVIGDMMNFDEEFKNNMIDMVIDSFYTFDKLDDGYLVNHNFVEMEKYLEMRKNTPQENLN